MITLEEKSPQTKMEKTVNYFFDHTLVGIVITMIGVFILCLWGLIKELRHPGSFYDFMEHRRIAEENGKKLMKTTFAYNDSEFLNKLKFIRSGIYDELYEGGGFYKNTHKRTFDFFKRNNIDIYSADFDPEYVAKCIREQKI